MERIPFDETDMNVEVGSWATLFVPTNKGVLYDCGRVDAFLWASDPDDPELEIRHAVLVGLREFERVGLTEDGTYAVPIFNLEPHILCYPLVDIMLFARPSVN